MHENSKNKNEQTPLEDKPLTNLDPEVIREKLLLVAEEWLPKLPSLLSEMKPEDMMSRSLINMSRPFLPRLSDLVIEGIHSAEQDKLLEMVDFVDGVSAWLKKD